VLAPEHAVVVEHGDIRQDAHASWFESPSLTTTFSIALRAGSFPSRFVQQREPLRDSPTTARRAQFEASFGIEIRQQNGGHLFNKLGYAHLA
jgi:hypothetical protein